MKTGHYYFTTSETGRNFEPRIFVSPQDNNASSNSEAIFFELRPGTTIQQSDALAAMLREFVSEVSISSM